jgi:hypothetical protein
MFDMINDYFKGSGYFIEENEETTNEETNDVVKKYTPKLPSIEEVEKVLKGEDIVNEFEEDNKDFCLDIMETLKILFCIS